VFDKFSRQLMARLEALKPNPETKRSNPDKIKAFADANPETLLQGMREHRASICFTAPTFYRKMAPLAQSLPALRHCVSSGEMLPADTRAQWLAATGGKVSVRKANVPVLEGVLPNPGFAAV
jgi:hypothetical protein